MRTLAAVWVLVALATTAVAPAGAEPAATNTALDLDALGRLPVQDGGRIKPFDSFARETLETLCGRTSWRGLSATEVVFSMTFDSAIWSDERILAIPLVELKERIHVPVERAYVSYNELTQTPDRVFMKLMRAAREKQERKEPLTRVEHEALQLFQRFYLVGMLFKAALPAMVPDPGATEDENVWTSFSDLPVAGASPVAPSSDAEGGRRPPGGATRGYAPATAERLQQAYMSLGPAFRRKDPAAWNAAVATLAAQLSAVTPAGAVDPQRLRLEVLCNQARPFRLSWVAYALVALFLLVTAPFGKRWLFWAGFAGALVPFLLTAAGMAARIYISGRPPVSNMFESLLWLATSILLLAFVFAAIYRSRLFVGGAALLGFITLVLGDHLPIDTSIGTLAPVLQSSWLIYHVQTVVASYGAFALAGFLGHVFLFHYLATGHRTPAQRELARRLDLYLYRTMQVGVLLLTVGTILGGVWANASWGRYWGWDPKETWALITLLGYLAILHSRVMGWVRGFGTALATVYAFLLVIMTYFGVNYFLVGLHSYAQGSNRPGALPPLLVVYLLVEAAVGVAAVSARRTYRAAAPGAAAGPATAAVEGVRTT